MSATATIDRPVTIRLNPADNVVVSRADLLPGAKPADEGVTCLDRIPRGHKAATRRIAEGEPVRKYNQVVGFASEDLAPGSHVHVHNVEMHDFDRDYAFGRDARATDYVPAAERAT